MEAPLKKFGELRAAMDNRLFTSYNEFPLIVGQKVYGTYVEADGKTYYSEGEIGFGEQSGFVVIDKDGFFTPVKLFWTLYFNPAS